MSGGGGWEGGRGEGANTPPRPTPPPATAHILPARNVPWKAFLVRRLAHPALRQSSVVHAMPSGGAGGGY